MPQINPVTVFVAFLSMYKLLKCVDGKRNGSVTFAANKGEGDGGTSTESGGGGGGGGDDGQLESSPCVRMSTKRRASRYVQM